MSSSNRERLQQQLLDLLAKIDFGRRYYEFTDRRSRSGGPALARATYEQLLAATGLRVRHDKREDFFALTDGNDGRVKLGVTLRDGMIEFGLSVATLDGAVGDPYAGLAHDLEARKGIAHDPPYPWVTFHGEPELREAIDFGVGLFREAHPLLASHPWRLPETRSGSVEDNGMWLCAAEAAGWSIVPASFETSGQPRASNALTANHDTRAKKTVLQIADCRVNQQRVLVLLAMHSRDWRSLPDVLKRKFEAAPVIVVVDSSDGHLRVDMGYVPRNEDQRTAARLAAAVIQARWGWDESARILVEDAEDVVAVEPRFDGNRWHATIVSAATAAT